MAINFDGKGNIETTTDDGVIAVKLYSLEKKLEEKGKEIERLNKKLESLEKLNNANYQSFIETNKVINEFEKWLEEKSQEYRFYNEYDTADTLDIALYKLQELKGSEK